MIIQMNPQKAWPTFEPLISIEKELELVGRVQDGIAALQELKAANTRFVYAVAKRHQGNGLSMEQLMEAGNKGLEEATRNYDKSKGYKFIPFAVWWIRKSIISRLNQTNKFLKK